MKTKILLLLVLLSSLTAAGQNKLHDFSPILGGLSGFQILVGEGVAIVSNVPVTIPATNLSFAANTTNYVYVDLSAGVISSNTSGFTSTEYPVAIVTTNSQSIAALQDVRSGAPGTGSSGGGTITGVTAGTALTGGGSSGSVTLNVANTSTTYFPFQSLTVTGSTCAAATLTAGVLNIPPCSVTGTVNSGTAGQIGIYSTTGSAISGDANLTDLSNVLSYAGSGGFNLPGDGTHSGALAIAGNTTVSTLLPAAGFFGFIGFNSTSATSYFFQPNATPPTNGQFLQAGTPATCVGSSATCIPLNFVSGTGAALSAITSATAANTPLTNGNFPQVFGWAQTTNSQTAFLFDDTSAATGTSDVLLGVTTAANSTETALGITCGAASTVFPASCFNVSLGANTGATNIPAINIAATWNNASIAGPLISAAVTNTSSAAASLIMNLLAGTGGATSEFSVNTTGVVFANNSFQTGTFEATSGATNTQFCGGQCTSAANTQTGGIVSKGSDDSAATSAGFAGPGIFRAGMLTNATPNAAQLNGMAQLGAGAFKGSAVANVGDVVCGTTTQQTVTDCPTGAVNVVGVANSTTAPIGFVGHGQVLVKLDGALTALGDIVCAPPTGGTAGLAHDNGSSPCTTSMYLGTIIGDSGTIVGMTGATVGGTAMSTTLAEVQLHIAPASSTGSGTVTVVSAGSLTSTALVTGGGTTTVQTPSATATLSSGGNMVLPGTLTTGSGSSTGYWQPFCGTAPSGTATFDTLYCDSSGLINILNGTSAGGIKVATLNSATNCSSSASPAVCGSAMAGSVYIPTGTTSETLVVNTTAVTANSQIMFYPDDTLGTKLGVTCNSTLATLVGGSFISARSAGTSFTITFNGTILTNGVCGSYLIVN